MNLKLTKPLAFFDLEATGINVIADRIVEISIIKLNPNGTEEVMTEKINPTIPIPKEVSEIHGIYDEDIKDAPTFKERAKDFDRFLKGCDLSGFNLIRFDVPMLVEEFLRAGIDFSIENRSIVDVQRIFHLMEPRNLSAAYKFYCNSTLENAHSAEADTRATMEVLLSQVDKYKGVKIKDAKSEKEIEPVTNNVKELHQLSTYSFADLVGRIAYNSKREEVFNFGKYRNKKVTDVFKSDPSYYDWIMKNDFALSTKKKLTELRLKMKLEM